MRKTGRWSSLSRSSPEAEARRGKRRERESQRSDEETDSDTGASSGSGGGFGGMVMPVGVYVVKDEKVRWIPAVNVNLIIIVVFVTLRMILRARFRAQRRAH
jgi:uncharacterized spore protein YtfJ